MKINKLLDYVSQASFVGCIFGMNVIAVLSLDALLNDRAPSILENEDFHKNLCLSATCTFLSGACSLFTMQQSYKYDIDISSISSNQKNIPMHK